MKLNKEEFRKLQKHWYQILKKEGFKDIEELKGNDVVLKQSAIYPYRNLSEFNRVMKEEYFRIMAQTAQSEEARFKNEIDKYVLLRFVEGAKIKIIVEELATRGDPRDRQSVRFIIRKYEMLWGIKSYDRRELHLKTR